MVIFGCSGVAVIPEFVETIFEGVGVDCSLLVKFITNIEPRTAALTTIVTIIVMIILGCLVGLHVECGLGVALMSGLLSSSPIGLLSTELATYVSLVADTVGPLL